MPVSLGSIVFYDATVLLGTPNVSQTKKPVRLVGYRVDGKSTGLLQTDMTSQQKKLHVFISFAGTSKYFLDGGSATLKSIILSQDRNTGSRYKNSETNHVLAPCHVLPQ